MTLHRFTSFIALLTESPVPIRIVPDDSTELASTSAAEYHRRTREIVIRQRYSQNEYLRNHEIGHALLHDERGNAVQPAIWIQEFRRDESAWLEFLKTSTARSYQSRLRISDAHKDDPSYYDWIEVPADLYMEFKAGRLSTLPHLLIVMRRVFPPHSL